MNNIKNIFLGLVTWLLITIFSWAYANIQIVETMENNHGEHINNHHSSWHGDHIERENEKEARVEDEDLEDLIK